MQQVWYVHGDEERFLFESKLAAETYARMIFPEEDPTARYSRVYSQRLVSDAEVAEWRREHDQGGKA